MNRPEPGLEQDAPALAVSFRLHQSTLCAPAASHDRTSPAANTAPTGVQPVVVEPFETAVSPITTVAVGSWVASSESMDACSDGIFCSACSTCESVGLAPPAEPENVNG